MRLAEMLARPQGQSRFEALRGADALLDYVPQVTPRYVRLEHMRPLANLFVAAERGPVLACSSFPPQHGKTVCIGHWIVRYMMRFPERRNAYVSYSIDRGAEVGRLVLDVAQRVGLRLKVSNQNRWITPQGGSLIFTGIGGPITGEPIDGIFIVDDAHKDREEANSVAIRKKAIEYVTVTAAGRRHPGTSMIVNGTRWHLDDVIGYLQEREKVEPVGWTFVNVPAINARGEALWPQQRPLDFLQVQRRILGEYDFSAEYLGAPVPVGHEVFHEPDRYHEPIEGVTLIACDPATTASTRADYSAIVVAVAKNVDGFMHMDVIDVRRLQVETPALVRELVGVQAQYKCPICVETAGAFKGVTQTLRSLDRNLRVSDITPIGDKFVRSQRVAAAWNDGRVRVPAPGSRLDGRWVEPFVREVRLFTGVKDDCDDQCDALAHCGNTLENMLRARRNVAAHVDAAMPFG
jgi:phage terminase large subunit-like protein